MPFGFATPIAPALEVWTTRSTPASSAASKTSWAPRRLVANTASRSAARSEVRPATWKTRSTPCIARRTARRSVTSPVDALELEPVEVAEVRAAAGEQAQLVAALGERANQVRAEETAAPVTSVFAIGPHATAVLIRLRPVGSDANTAVVTDTTAYLPDELVAEHGIHRVSLYVTLDGEQRRESEIGADEYDEFFERLRNSAEGATTSQPSVGDFTERLRAAARRGPRDRLRSTSQPGSPAPTSRRCRHARR